MALMAHERVQCVAIVRLHIFSSAAPRERRPFKLNIEVSEKTKQEGGPWGGGVRKVMCNPSAIPPWLVGVATAPHTSDECESEASQCQFSFRIITSPNVL